jgi:peptide deformylase
MVRDIVTYPDKRITITSPDVRLFDEALASVIQDLKDTMEAHNAKAMAAIQIAIPMSLIVVKQDDGSYLEIINPRIIGKKGKIISEEETLYFPDTKHTVERYDEIRLIYQDRTGEQKSMKAKGDLSVLLQRKIDYVYGDTLASRVGAKNRKEMEKELAQVGLQGSFESCPTVFMKDYFTSFIQKILFFMTLSLLTPLFNFSKESVASIWNFDKYASFVVIALLFGYLFVGIWEGKKYTSCTSCQIGNILGTMAKYFLATAVITTAAYYLLN